MIKEFTFQYNLSGTDRNWYKGTVGIDIPDEHTDEIVPLIRKAIRGDELVGNGTTIDNLRYKTEEATAYYFISYQWRRTVLHTSNSSTWRIESEVINIHPVKWLCDTRNKYDKVLEHGEYVRYDYALIGWNEIPKDIYDTYEGELG